ncbi:MAG: hypothetical protein JOZ69_25410 [Myxococcales bacterium]|nr:hypothetical protein [Myxococcales bacterium]
MNPEPRTPTEPDAPHGAPASSVQRLYPAAPEAAAPRVHSYDELDGGQGREVYFRPHRYQREDLGPVRPLVRVRLHAAVGSGGATGSTASRECVLRDISQSGAALEWPSDVPVHIGAMLPELVLSFDDYEAYRGEARVGSVRELDGRIIVGVSLLDSLMNIEDVLILRDLKTWMPAGADGLGRVAPPWRVPGHDTFKALTAELALFLGDARRELGALEESLPWHVVHGEQPSPARDALVRRVQGTFVPEFVRYAEDIDRAARTATAAELEHLKEFSRRNLHALLLESPLLHRAYRKPLGYPGDYEVMRYMYEHHFVGSTLFAKALNLAVAHTRAVGAVRARKDVIKERLSRLLDERGGGAPLRVLAIASGPAQEIHELLGEREAIESPVEIVLFDQDKRALSFAYSRLKRLVDARWAGRVKVVYLHDSIKRLLRDVHVFDGVGTFDLVFSSGLFDYLQLRTAVVLCRNLFAHVAQGAALYVGNMVPANPNRWIMDLHLDWPLVYRTETEMTDFARLASPEATIEIVEEKTGLNPFVRLTRR